MCRERVSSKSWLLGIGEGIVCLGVIFFAMSGKSSGHTESVLHIDQYQIYLEGEKLSSENAKANLKVNSDASHPDKAQEQKNPQDAKEKEPANSQDEKNAKSNSAKSHAPDLAANIVLNDDGRNSITAHLGDVILLELFKTT